METSANVLEQEDRASRWFYRGRLRQRYSHYYGGDCPLAAKHTVANLSSNRSVPQLTRKAAVARR